MSRNYSLLSNTDWEQIIEQNFITVNSQTLVTEAIALMSKQQSSCILIAEQKQLTGIFTARDVIKLTASAQELESIAISEVMTKKPIVISQKQACSLVKIIALFQKHSIHHLPLIDRDGQVFGVITPETVRKVLQPIDLLQLRRVDEMMTKEVVWASKDQNLLQIAKLMAEQRLSCVVIGETNLQQQIIPIGIVTERDILECQYLGLDLQKTKAESIIRSPLLAVLPTDSLWDAHRLMQKNRVRRLVVTDSRGSLVGIVTQTTLLQVIDLQEVYASVTTLERLLEQHTIQLKTEIAKQKSLKEKLNTSESQLRSVLAAMTDLVFILDREGKNIQLAVVNESNFSSEQHSSLIKKTLEQLWQGEQEETVLAKVQQVIKTQQTISFDYSIFLEQQQFWFSAQIAPMPDNLAIWIARDITPQRQAEIRLRNAQLESEEKVKQRTTELQIANQLLQQQINTYFPANRKVSNGRIVHALNSYPWVAKLDHNIENFLVSSTKLKLPWWTGAAIATLLMLLIESCRYWGILLPIPYLLLIITVMLSASFGGIQAGLCSTGVWGFYVIYAAMASLGESNHLAGGVFPITLSIFVVGLGTLVQGWTREQNIRLTRILRFVNKNLEQKIKQRTRELSIVNNSLRKEVGDRIAAEKALQENKAHLNLIVDSVPAAIMYVDAQQCLRFVNQYYEKWIGKSQSEVIGKQMRAVVGESNYQIIQPNAELVLKGEDVNYQTVFTLPNGNQRKISVHYVPHYSETKIVKGFFALIQDITEFQQAQQAQQESEQKFRATFEQAAVGIVHLGIDNKFLRVNQKFCEIVGYSAEELQEYTCEEITHPKDRASDAQYIHQLLAGETSIPAREKRYIRADGSIVWGNHTVSIVRHRDGKPAYFVAVIEDISDRKEAEVEREVLLEQIEQERQFLETILQQMPAGVIIAEAPSGQIIMKNEQVTQILRQEVQPASQLENYSQFSAISSDGQPYQFEDYPLIRACRKGETVTGSEIDHLCGDGIFRTMYVNAAPVYNREQELVAGVVTFYDITDIKRAKEIKKEAENKATLLKEIHHRIKNNLQIVSTLLDLQTEYIKEPQILKLLQESQARIYTMALIHEKLYRAKNLEQIDFWDYVHSLAEYLHDSYIQDCQQVVFTLNIDRIYLNIDLAIPCGLIINELIVNALQHGFPEGRSGEILVKFSQLSSAKFSLIVSDNGIGLPKDIELGLEESLGLRLVHSLVTMQLEGTIVVERNQGTLFKIEFSLQ